MKMKWQISGMLKAIEWVKDRTIQPDPWRPGYEVAGTIIGSFYGLPNAADVVWFMDGTAIACCSHWSIAIDNNCIELEAEPVLWWIGTPEGKA